MTETSKAWTLDEIREELEKQRVDPSRTVKLAADQVDRLLAGRWRVVTVAPGDSAAEVWEVDAAELMWLMLRSIEASQFVVSVVPLGVHSKSILRDTLRPVARVREMARV